MSIEKKKLHDRTIINKSVVPISVIPVLDPVSTGNTVKTVQLQVCMLRRIGPKGSAFRDVSFCRVASLRVCVSADGNAV